MTNHYTLSLNPKSADDADPQAQPMLEQARASLGMVPNMYANLANSPGLLSTYLHGYECFRQDSGFTPAEQEVVFLTVSRENGCHYCMAAHSVIADTQSKVPKEVTDAIRDGSEIPDAKLAAVSTFARAMFQSRGLPQQDDVQAFLDAGYTERHVLEVVLAIAVKTISNYANHLFDTEVDKPFAGRAWKG
ncbi:carboxymuconolactone decarboxylase family protein [Modicisalibacter xianhensis]|nr:carboxymuconolactone decarboxylase family protein [Halomonas xianhensis]